MMVQIKTNKKNLFYATALAIILQGKISLATDIDTNMARMQALDKITGRVNEIDIPVGGEAKFGSFSIVIRRCVTRSPEETPENTAFVDVADTYNQETPQNIFKGWMFSSSPALNAVEHPIYDVWLLKCYNGDSSKHAKLSSEELARRDDIPMQKTDFFPTAEEPQELTVSQESAIETIDEQAQKTETISVVVDSSTPQSNNTENNDTIDNISISEIDVEENGFDNTDNEFNIEEQSSSTE